MQGVRFMYRLSLKRIVGMAIVIVLGSCYLTTMNRTVSFIDAGELASVVSTLGIAHPTGYPLFTLLGRIVAWLGGGHILALNVFASILVAIAMGGFFQVCLLIGRVFVLEDSKSGDGSGISEQVLIAGAAAGTGVVGLSTTVWAQSTAIEVYSLHLLLLMGVMFAFVRGLYDPSSKGQPLTRWFVFFAFLLGVSFSNHMTTLLLAPAFLYLYFAERGFKKPSFVVLLQCAPFFVLGLSLYLYLPLRASSEPPLDWGHPASLERFLWHISGKQYRSWIFSGFDSAEKQFTYFVRHFSSEFQWASLAVLVAGFMGLLRRSRRLLMFILLLILGCLAYAINYDIHDIDSYFLLAYLGAGFFIAFGFVELIVLTKQGTIRRTIVIIGLAILPLFQWWNNHHAVDESDNTLVRDYTMNVFASLEPNALLLTYQWDYFVSSSYYTQVVEQYRPDVVVIDKELLRRSWYFLQLARNHPWLIERSREKVETFLKELGKFEHELPYDGAVIEASYDEMINDMLDKAMETRPVYVGPEIEPQFGSYYQRVPEGLVFRLQKPGAPAVLRPLALSYHPTSYKSDLTEGLIFQYKRMLAIRAFFLKNEGKTEEASQWIKWVLELDPSYPPALRLKEEISASKREK